MVKEPERSPSPAVARAVALLELLATEPSTLSKLSRKLDVPKSSLHGIVTTLNQQGWVESEAGHYVLGKKLFQTGILYGRNRGLVAAFENVAPDIVRKTGETTWLGVLEGRDVLHVARLEGTEPLRFVVREGERIPAHGTALGKVILADKDPDELDSIFGSGTLPVLTSDTIVELPPLKEHLRTVREQGFALDKGEVYGGLHCVAAPVRDSSGNVVAGVSIAGAVSRFSQHLSADTDIIADAALVISRRLGYEIGEHGMLPSKAVKETSSSGAAEEG